MRQVLLITKSFPPVHHSGTIRLEAFVRHLPAWGFQPMVLTASVPVERKHSIEDALWNEQRMDVDWSVPRTRLLGKLARLPGMSSFVKSRHRLLLANRSLMACADHHFHPEIILASCPPGDTLFLGTVLAKHFNCPLVCDFRDPWSYWPMPLYRHWLDFRFEKQVEQRVLDQADAITVTTSASGQLLQQEFGVPAQKIHLIPNGYEPSEFTGAETFEPIAAEPERFHIVYTGALGSSREIGMWSRFSKQLGFQYDPLHTHYAARSPRWFLEGLEKFLTDSLGSAAMIRVWFIGEAKLGADPVIANFPYADVLRVVPRVPSRVAIGAIQQANLLLLLQLETFLHGEPFCVAVPGKLYSYLASGQRILAGVQRSENTELINRFNAGVTVDSTSATEFATAIRSEFDRWKSGASLPAKYHPIPEFERSTQTAQLARLFESLISSQS